MIAVRNRWAGIVLAQCCMALVSVAVARGVVATEAIDAGTGEVVLAAAGLMAALCVAFVGPVACIAAIGALTILQLLPTVPVVAGVDLVAADVFYAALLCWWLVRVACLGAHTAGAGSRAAVRGGAVLVFLVYVGLTLAYVQAVDAGRLTVSLVSWLRLLQTASLGWLAASFLRTRRDVAVVLGALAATAALAVVVALAAGAGQSDAGPLGVRGGGLLNPNQLGLVSGLLLLMGALGAIGPSLRYRAPAVVVGAVGLVQAQSVGSLVGTGVALMLGLAFMVAPPRRLVAMRALRALMALAVGIAIAYAVAGVIRPTNLPTSDRFREGSAGQRTVLAAAGLEIAARHPVIGVGWHRSEEPELIGDPDLNAVLRARFPATRDDFFPDVNPTSVHNAYVQVAADLGLIGFALFVVMLVSLARQLAGVLRRVGRRVPEWPQLWFLAWGLVLVVVWWNDNALFGGQAETVMPAMFVGAIAGLSRALPSEGQSPATRLATEVSTPQPAIGARANGDRSQSAGSYATRPPTV
jgi:O-antigen ligase